MMGIRRTQFWVLIITHGHAAANPWHLGNSPVQQVRWAKPKCHLDATLVLFPPLLCESKQRCILWVERKIYLWRPRDRGSGAHGKLGTHGVV